jgi:uncharacterized protein YdaU (DUF1376 family)
MKNPPSFQFYPQDFMSDLNVQKMTMEERGVYITLLCHCWIEDGLPTDDGDPIGTLFKSHAVAKCFIKKKGKFRNPRLDRERAKQLVYHKSQQEAGLRGAEARWGRHNEPIATPMAKHSSSSSSSSLLKKPPTPLKGGDRKPNNRKTRRLAVGASLKKDHDAAYWAEHARLKAQGLSGPALTDALEKGKEKK